MPVRHRTNDRLAAGIDVRVLDPHCLLPAALDLGERLSLCGERAKQLRGERAMGLHLLRRSGPPSTAKHDDGVEYQVGVRMMRFPGGGFWARFVCPRCDGGSQRLRLLDGEPACVKCIRASGLIYRSQSIRTEKRHAVTAPPRIALICRDTPMRVNARPNRVAERRVNAENALRRSLIVARAWRAAKASKVGI